MAQETTSSAPVPREMTVARWLFNPYIRIAGGQALAVGLTVILMSGLVAAAGIGGGGWRSACCVQVEKEEPR